MSSRLRLLPVAIAAFLLVFWLLATSANAAVRPGLFGPATQRAVNAVTYLQMRETTSLRPNGDGEERIEFLIRNDGSTSLSSAEFWFDVGSTQYWGIDASDAQGAINHTIVVDGDLLRVTVHYRQPVAPGAQYRYTFVINFPGLAEESGDEWTFDWGTSFPVAEFIRTVYLPGGGQVTYTDPPPDEQTADYVRWTRYNITLFTLTVRYSLRALTDQELAEEFAPSFRLHPDDAYVPMSVALALAHAECYPSAGGQPQSCSTELLGQSWLNSANSYIDFQGYPGDRLDAANGSEQYYRNHIKANVAPLVYARVWRGSGRIVIQYWLYYYYNSWGWQGGLGLGAGLHEGDWEMAQVVLDSEAQPLYAVYAQHLNLPLTGFKGASKKEWNDLARDTADGDHPIVYTALGSHASYFGPYRYLHDLDQTASEATELLRPAVYLLQPSGADPWVNYAGQWGQPGRALAFQGGPASPARQGQKWGSPLAWGETSVDWDEYSAHHLGKIRAHADAPCNVGVEIVDTGRRFGWVFNEYREEIDGGEYVVNETHATRSLILHNTYETSIWLGLVHTTCPAGGTPSAHAGDAPELTVEFYDDARDEVVTARYTLPADWMAATTIGTVTLNDPALALAVDRDNDGATDAVVPPDSVTSEPLQPPQGVGGRLFVPTILR